MELLKLSYCCFMFYSRKHEAYNKYQAQNADLKNQHSEPETFYFLNLIANVTALKSGNTAGLVIDNEPSPCFH